MKKHENMKNLLISLLLLNQLVFLNASELMLIRELQIHETEDAEPFNKDLYARNIPALIERLQNAVDENDRNGRLIEPFLKFNNTINGYNLLHIAALGASVELTELALKVGVNVNREQTNRSLDTPLHYASGDSWSKKENERPSCNLAGRLAVAKLLLDGGAEVNRMNRSHQTPLIYAIQEENIDLVDLFLKRGARVNFDNEYDYKQPLYRACRNNNLQIVTMLLEHGANPFCVAGKLRIHCKAQKNLQACCCLEIKKIVTLYARNLIPCSKESSKWEEVIAKLGNW